MSKIWLVFVFISISIIGKTQNLTVYRSEKSVIETVEAITTEITQRKELIFFETVSHDEIAKERGLKLAPTKSILFEDPALTTILINCQQTAALDLPLEILVWEESGDVYIGFIDPKYMVRRFMIDGCDDTIQQLSALLIRVSVGALKNLH
jgi:uncharacterized protein (DUF302 family)